MSKTGTGAELNPTAEVRADVGKIIVSVGEGYYEVYIDQKMQQPALNYHLTHEYPAEPGEHRVSVYSAGRFVFDKMITVPAEEATPGTNPLMDFADAIRAVKAGKRICRAGWNGKHQFVELASCLSYKNAEGEIINAEHEAIGSQALAFVGTSGIQIGWLASQADMLANDWQIAVISEYAVMPQRGA